MSPVDVTLFGNVTPGTPARVADAVRPYGGVVVAQTIGPDGDVTVRVANDDPVAEAAVRELGSRAIADTSNPMSQVMAEVHEIDAVVARIEAAMTEALAGIRVLLARTDPDTGTVAVRGKVL